MNILFGSLTYFCILPFLSWDIMFKEGKMQFNDQNIKNQIKRIINFHEGICNLTRYASVYLREYISAISCRKTYLVVYIMISGCGERIERRPYLGGGAITPESGTVYLLNYC